MIRYPFALVASLIEDERQREAFVRRSTRNAINPYAVIRKITDPERPKRPRQH